MTIPDELDTQLDFQALLDGMGQGVLVFDPQNTLILDNLAARHMLGANLARIRQDGWSACAGLINASLKSSDLDAEALRSKAFQETKPIRFRIALDGAVTPGWLSAIYLQSGEVLTQVCLEKPDWTPFTNLMDTFRNEARQAVTATRGHADLLTQLALNRNREMSADDLAGRVIGFSEIMVSHMYRLEMLMDLVHRWEIILTGQIHEALTERMRVIELEEWLEDYLETLLDQSQVDPEIGLIDYRERLVINVAQSIHIRVSPHHLGTVLRDMLRNAVLYTTDNSPIILQAMPLPNSPYVRVDIIDRGCGVRAKEMSKIFAPFERAMQPQVISQFGYGLSLFLGKLEIEAMGGEVEVKSEEGVGSVFSLKLRAWEPDKDETL